MLINCIFKKNILKKRATLFLLSPYILMSICLASLVFSTHLWASYNQTVIGPAWGDHDGWDQPEYYSTIRYPDLNGDGKADICGREGRGILCYLRRVDAFVPSTFFLGLSNAEGWNQPEYYSTIRYPEINGDGKADICARSKTGVKCYLNTGKTFVESTFFLGWSDDKGWHIPTYHATIRYPDLNGDGKADICGRLKTGVKCYLNTGTSFTDSNYTVADWSDANSWNHHQYYATIHYPDLNGDNKADVCGRSRRGIECRLNVGSRFSSSHYLGPDWADAVAWDQRQYYLSIQYPDINSDGKADICGRSGSGVVCHLSLEDSFSSVSYRGPEWTDADGWDKPGHYSTIGYSPVIGENLDICSRTNTGIKCYKNYVKYADMVEYLIDGEEPIYHHPHGEEHEERIPLKEKSSIRKCIFSNCIVGLTLTGPEWSDANGWNKPEYYSTIRYPMLDRNKNVSGICGRSSHGIKCYYRGANL
ncbi:hypothetical protein AB835_13115 [Candidatus Endobugula sertula]|uniref:Insecticide toxin TcdB middle/N-terminal domain-containing protein n=1 Tax=Candidatus Endobugula sertula TaxID=62101 RepID=A0A1D2QM49_9GAMM|nr:hypothetical protein AB835_13115 [Candidatus Endobugula sertula]